MKKGTTGLSGYAQHQLLVDSYVPTTYERPYLTIIGMGKPTIGLLCSTGVPAGLNDVRLQEYLS